MMKLSNNEIIEEPLLLKMFNDRDHAVFGKIYLHLYDELYYFANKVFHGVNLTTEDIIQDIFINVWENKNRKFDSLEGLKAYLYISVKNKFIKYIHHDRCIREHIQYSKQQEDSFVMLIAENEVMSVLSKSVELIPEECAKVFKLCLEGWDIKEIAVKLDKSESTVYKQRNEAIRTLRKKLSREKMLLLLMFLPQI